MTYTPRGSPSPYGSLAPPANPPLYSPTIVPEVTEGIVAARVLALQALHGKAPVQKRTSRNSSVQISGHDQLEAEAPATIASANSGGFSLNGRRSYHNRYHVEDSVDDEHGTSTSASKSTRPTYSLEQIITGDAVFEAITREDPPIYKDVVVEKANVSKNDGMEEPLTRGVAVKDIKYIGSFKVDTTMQDRVNQPVPAWYNSDSRKWKDVVWKNAAARRQSDKTRSTESDMSPYTSKQREKKPRALVETYTAPYMGPGYEGGQRSRRFSFEPSVEGESLKASAVVVEGLDDTLEKSFEHLGNDTSLRHQNELEGQDSEASRHHSVISYKVNEAFDYDPMSAGIVLEPSPGRNSYHASLFRSSGYHADNEGLRRSRTRSSSDILGSSSTYALPRPSTSSAQPLLPDDTEEPFVRVHHRTAPVHHVSPTKPNDALSIIASYLADEEPDKDDAVQIYPAPPHAYDPSPDSKAPSSSPPYPGRNSSPSSCASEPGKLSDESNPPPGASSATKATSPLLTKPYRAQGKEPGASVSVGKGTKKWRWWKKMRLTSYGELRNRRFSGEEAHERAKAQEGEEDMDADADADAHERKQWVSVKVSKYEPDREGENGDGDVVVKQGWVENSGKGLRVVVDVKEGMDQIVHVEVRPVGGAAKE